jgi:hypothetical protein
VCSNLSFTTEVTGTGYARGEWIDVSTAVVAFDHSTRLDVEHALCIDFRSENGDPSARVAVELDAASARRLAESILITLDGREARELA